MVVRIIFINVKKHKKKENQITSLNMTQSSNYANTALRYCLYTVISRYKTSYSVIPKTIKLHFIIYYVCECESVFKFNVLILHLAPKIIWIKCKIILNVPYHHHHDNRHFTFLLHDIMWIILPLLPFCRFLLQLLHATSCIRNTHTHTHSRNHNKLSCAICVCVFLCGRIPYFKENFS